MNFEVSKYSFTVIDTDKFGRDIVQKDGWVNVGTVLAKDEHTIVIAWKGYSENPGSRYSGLYDYYPAITEVFKFDHVDKFGRVRYVSLIEWETKPKKKGERK
jgi:hypothetical protein